MPKTVIDSFTGEFRFLSNFWPAVVYLDDACYPTVENAYQAAKTRNLELRKPFQTCSPVVAKQRGRKLLFRSDWEQVKLRTMKDLLFQKFSHPDLAELLSRTGCQELIEGNHWNDTFWGVCNGVGENHLGKLLMEVRYQHEVDASIKKSRRENA